MDYARITYGTHSVARWKPDMENYAHMAMIYVVILRLISTWAIMELLHSPQNTTCRKWQSTSKINTIVVSRWYITQIQPVVSIGRIINTAGRYHVRPIDSTVKLATAFSAVKLTVIKVTNLAWFACVVCENNVKQNYNEFIIEICANVISCHLWCHFTKLVFWDLLFWQIITASERD